MKLTKIALIGALVTASFADMYDCKLVKANGFLNGVKDARMTYLFTEMWGGTFEYSTVPVKITKNKLVYKGDTLIYDKNRGRYVHEKDSKYNAKVFEYPEGIIINFYAETVIDGKTINGNGRVICQ